MNKMIVGIGAAVVLAGGGYVAADYIADQKAQEVVAQKIEEAKAEMPAEVREALTINYDVDYNILSSVTTLNNVKINVEPDGGKDGKMVVNAESITFKGDETKGDFDLGINKLTVDVSDIIKNGNRSEREAATMLKTLGLTEKGVDYSVSHNYKNDMSNIKLTLNSDVVGSVNVNLETSKLDPYIQDPEAAQKQLQEMNLASAVFSYTDKGGITNFIKHQQETRNLDKAKMIKDMDRSIARAERRGKTTELQAATAAKQLFENEKGTFSMKINPEKPVPFMALMFMMEDGKTVSFDYQG